MKKHYLPLLALCLAGTAYAQAPLSTSNSIEKVSHEMALSISAEGLLLNEKRDELGFVHQKIQQKSAGFPIEGAQLNLITSPNGDQKMAGKRLQFNLTTPSNVVPFETALFRAMAAVETDEFYWQDETQEKLIKNLENNPKATFYPKKELVWFDSSYSSNPANYRLAYKIELYYHGEVDHKTFFVDAKSAEVIYILESCNHASVEGLAKTRYHGERVITTDSIAADSFVLYDRTRGGGIETLNLRTYKSLDSAQSFVDDDNYWDHDNAEMDNAATDVHWGSEMTYDYFIQKHGRNSFDGKGSKILSYLHYDKNWRNASWNGKYARYGDGNSNPLTSIDVVAHELTHGVTRTSSGLIYRNESGALNESFSDIFGTAVEFFAAPEEANWAIGKENFYLREMGKTKQFSHPNCYGGVYWYTGTGDNGGVHINSGVQNFWFYLLANGGSGTNDLGNDYSVDSIGLEKAARIAYRNLVYYLTPSSTFADARAGAIEAAKDIFGSCSHEVQQVVAAWYAVGVGSEEHSDDLAITDIAKYQSNCELHEEWVEVQFTYRESPCDSSIKAGDSIHFYYQVNQNPPVKETLILSSDINLFDTLDFRFKEKADFSAINQYDVVAWLEYENDFIKGNDSSDRVSITHRTSPDKIDIIGFEPVDYDKEKLFFTLENRPFSRVEITIPARKNGVRGLGFTGEPSGRISEFVAPKSEEEIFNTYPDNISKMCMCIDARSWADVRLSFDLRQTYSAIYYEHLENYEPKKMTSLRVTANGVQIDSIFHPDTLSSDPWENIVMNLDHLSGQRFELCFEGQHFISRTSFSSENVGDNSYVDNINLSYSSVRDAGTGYGVSLFPNPVESFLNVVSYEEKDQVLDLKFFNSIGQEVLEGQVNLEYGQNSKIFDLSELANGLYILQSTHRGETRTQKILVH